MPATPEQIQAIRAIANVLLETVQEMGEQGAPSGPMYAAVMHRLSLDQYTHFMDGLVKAGHLRQDGHVYYFVKGM